MLKQLPISIGSNLDLDATSAHDGTSVACFNCYADRSGAVRTIPGLQLHDDTASGGTNVYEYYSKSFDTRVTVSKGRVWVQHTVTGTRTEYTGSGLVAGVPPTFAEDATHIFVAANSSIYKIDTVLEKLVALTAGNPPTAVTSLLYHLGYLIANGPEIAGDTTYSDDKLNGYALWEVYNSESKPDRLQTLLLVDSQFIYNIGPESLEVTYVGTNATNPFELNRGRISSFGTMAKYSPVYNGEAVYYLSEVTQSRKIVQNTSGSCKIISFPIDVPIEQFERVDDAEGFIMAFRGQNFYVLHFPTANSIIAEQYWNAITLAYHIQKEAWFILAAWDTTTATWSAYRGGSFLYIEPWNLRLIGSRTDAKTYSMYESDAVDYTSDPIMTHRWRSDNNKEWSNPRRIALGHPGDYKRPPDQHQCGMYRNRQHEFAYTDMTDAGSVYRASLITGNVHHGSDTTKRSNFYRYNIKRGDNGFILNSITEDVDILAI
jgi:hypothetical protein